MSHRHTSHGHPCCDQAAIGGHTGLVARCGGPGLCGKCKTERDLIHIPDPTTAYLSLRTGATGLAVAHRDDIARTIEISPTLLVDVDADGRVLGIESLAGPIGYPELIEILRAVRVTEEPSRG